VTRDSFLRLCAQMPGAVIDQPFEGDFVTTVARHQGNRRWFAILMEGDEGPFVNLKCEPLKGALLRGAYRGITPGWHMNKEHWISVGFRADVPDGLLRLLVEDSHRLTAPKRRRRRDGEGTEETKGPAGDFIPRTP